MKDDINKNEDEIEIPTSILIDILGLTNSVFLPVSILRRLQDFARERGERGAELASVLGELIGE